MDKVENKQIGGFVTETKQETREGVPVGLISGYIATWDIDRGDDMFLPGAFVESIQYHIKRNNRPIRFKDGHGRTVGGFPITGIREDEKGLFGTAEVNLDVQQGKELYSLAKQGVITDFSIGYTAVDWEIKNGIRIIAKANIWEGSAVDEPMNIASNIIDVKAATSFQDLPLADRDRPWNSTAAIGRVRTLTESTESPSASYKNAFLWYDRADNESYGAYKLPFADVIDGKLVAVPRGIFAAAAAMQGARGGVDIPDADRSAVENHINRYYKKMDMDSPFEKSGLGIIELETMDAKDIEKYLRGIDFLSKQACIVMASRFVSGRSESDKGNRSESGSDYIEELKKLNETLKGV